MTKPTIILSIPTDFGISVLFKKNLLFCGFEVFDLCFEDYNFKYPSIFHRLYNLSKKLILNDHSYKDELRLKGVRKRLKKLDSKADYALIIRADKFPIDVIKKIKKNTRQLIGYQWDGLSRYPQINDRVKFFDKFFIFQKVDLKLVSSGLSLTNFYFDFDDTKTKENIIEFDLIYIGSWIKERESSVFDILNELLQLNLKLNIYFLTSSSKEKKNLLSQKKGIHFINTFFSYEESLALVQQSKMILDLVNPLHGGLSLRVFEALRYEKKLITNNKNIEKYDFFHPNNIFIFDENNLHLLKKFIKLPYQKVDLKTKEKYGFSNWINYVLDKDAYTPIDTF